MSRTCAYALALPVGATTHECLSHCVEALGRQEPRFVQFLRVFERPTRYGLLRYSIDGSGRQVEICEVGTQLSRNRDGNDVIDVELDAVAKQGAFSEPQASEVFFREGPNRFCCLVITQ
jgi:hypothetical protein